MKEEIEKAIKELTEKSSSAEAGEALKFTQAALNLSHIQLHQQQLIIQ